MTKIPTAGERIYALRKALGMDKQEQLAKAVDASVSAVSTWERGEFEPSPESYLALGNLAVKSGRIDEGLWFWRRSGLDEKAMLVAAGKVLKAEPSEMVAGLLRGLPAKTSWLVVDEKTAGAVFAPGDTIIVDESESDALPDLRPFWNRVVLVDFFVPRAKRPTGGADYIWPEGLCMGRLSLKLYPDDTGLVWAVEFGPLSESFRVPPLYIGWYQYQIPPEDRDVGLNSRRAKDHREAMRKAESLAPANARLQDGCRILGRAVAWFSGSGEK